MIGPKPPGEADEDFTVLVRLADASETQIVRSLLASAGIPVRVQGDAFVGAFGGTALFVPESLAEEANELIARYKRGECGLDEPETPGETSPAAEAPPAAAGRLRTFRVYAPPGGTTPVVVKEGFSWPAFFFNWIWFLVNGLWVEFAAVLALEIGAWALLDSHRASPAAAWLLAAYFAGRILIGRLANARLCHDLERKGYAKIATVRAKNEAYAREAAARPA
ncbi:MAG: DUF2628 domain-containing protein, partial [Candidatus Accumulibacter sp.]|nr:DUF2628 domain-containing protein [Accumulibacter sp.]